ncbi:MAG TPA: hypothetical protein VGD78_16870 [Chthoniobacterales bacterium]
MNLCLPTLASLVVLSRYATRTCAAAALVVSALAASPDAIGQNVLTVARHELGVKQSSARVAEYLKVLSTADFFTVETSNGWCGAYAQWALRASGLPLPASNRQSDWMRYGQAAADPQPGDVAVFAHHVAFFLASRGDQVCVLGGAQGAVQQEPSVCGLWVNRSLILAFRRPAGHSTQLSAQPAAALGKRNAG